MKQIWEERHRSTQGRYNRVTEFAKFCYFNFLKDKKGKLLDLACGKGADSVFFCYKGLNVTAVDYSTEAINQFNMTQKEEGLFITTLVSDIRQKLPFEKNTFDFVYSRIGLNYFDEKTTKEIFKEIKRVLKSEGMLMFQVKSVSDKEYGQGEQLEKDFYKDEQGYMRRFFSEDSAKLLLKGYKIIYMEEKKIDNGNGYLDVIAKN